MKHFLFALVLLLLAAPASAPAQAQGMKVHARLVAETHAIAPGGTTTIALVETIAPGWHTYWKNPGDAGAPTRIQWTLPDGWTVDPIQWPRPKRLPVGPLMDYGYEGILWLPMTLHAPASVKPGDKVTLQGHATWLVCSNICIPESSDVSLTLPVGPQAPNPAVVNDFAAARARLPVASPWKFAYALDESGKALDLFVAAPALVAAHPAVVDFFPAEAGTIENAAPQRVGYAKDGLVLRLTPSDKFSGALNGLLVLTGSDGSTQALDVSAQPGTVPPAVFEAPAASSMGGLTVWLAVGFALLGGLILNIMPCVLPILAMKALAVARHGGEGRGESFSYAGGAIISFAALGLLIVALRAGGTAVGWGFQLQNPVAVGGFALLIFAVGLNLSGVFEVGTITAGDRLARGGGLVGAFFTGVLAVAVAAPCTAPFMAAALGFALTHSALLALAVFVALGIGFALPFLLLGVWPRALAFLPKPGLWMVRLKQFLAFPMYAAAVWLVWVLAQQAGPSGVVIVLGAFVAVALAAWGWSVTRGGHTGGRLTGAVVALVVVALALYGVGQIEGPAASGQGSTRQVSALGEPYSAAALAQYRQAGRPVFVDATAAWCITCLVNEEAVLSTPRVKDAFARHKVAYLVADWTNQDPAVTELLKKNGRPGVPMYLYYAPGVEKPRILPQLLTVSTVLAAIGE
jgi:thiol:disulfide interchange protein DsbD